MKAVGQLSHCFDENQSEQILLYHLVISSVDFGFQSKIDAFLLIIIIIIKVLVKIVSHC